MLVLSGLLCDVRSAECIGQTGHMVVAEMASMDIDATAYPELVKILYTFGSERNCGSVFPDWAWPSFYQQYSRIAHTVEFQQTWADYVKVNSPPPYTISEKREVSFLMGITAHTYGDPPWHIFFLPEVKAYDDAEEWLAEPGTDIFANWELGKRNEITYGYLPVSTAVNVYSLMGYPEVTESMLVKGMMEVLAFIWAEKMVDYRGYLALIHRMPWTNDNYITYSPGGFAYGAEIAAPEMVSTWNYIQGNLDQLQLKDMPVFSERDIPIVLGQSLLESDAIAIPTHRSKQGEYFFGEPRIVDPDTFREIISGLEYINLSK